MPQPVIEIPVLIAGGGPVGVTLAMDLAWRGVKSVVLERRREIPPNPRCNTTNARSMEIFRRLGCAQAARAAGLPIDHNTDIVYMTAFNADVLTRYERPTTRDVLEDTQSGVGANWPTPEPQHFISQLYLEPVLREHAVSHFDVDLRTGWELVSAVQDADHVLAVARDVDTGEEVTIRADYMVGADGSGSMVRHQVGARLQGIPSLGNVCSTFFRSKDLRALYDRTPGWMYRFVGSGVLVAIDGSDLWLLHVTVPQGADPDGFDPEPAMFGAIGQAFDYEVVSRARWTPRAMVANRFRDRRIFLAGDAAHLWVPMGGFGMNAGVADAAALGWLLTGVMQGWLDPKALDSYEVERAPLGGKVAAQAARWSIDLRPLTTYVAPERIAELQASPAARLALGEQIRQVNLGEFDCPGFQLGFCYTDSPIIAYDGAEPPPMSLEDYRESSWPGVRAPHIWRADGASLFDQLGKGFALLRIGADAPSGQPLMDLAKARGVPLTVLALDEPEAWVKYEGFGLVLVRPDGHIAWRAKADPQDAATVLDRVTGVLVPERTVAEHAAERVADGFLFGEGARWIDGRLVFSDMLGCKVLAFDPTGAVLETLAEVPHQPNGLGVLPDGRLVIASMYDAKLYVAEGGALSILADLKDLVRGYLGDLVVDAKGRIYVDDVGSRVLHGEPIQPGRSRVILVETDGAARVVLEGLDFANGLAISPDGQMLYVADTPRQSVLQCRIAPGGDLGDARPFVTFEAGTCDGMAGDAAGGLWFCSPRGERAVLRYDAGGRLTDRVRLTDGAAPIACALGGADGRTLYVVGIEPVGEGPLLFDAMMKKQTRGAVWSARLDG